MLQKLFLSYRENHREIFKLLYFGLIKLSLNCRKIKKVLNFLLGFKMPESEFNEFKPRLKSAKNRFQLSVGLNLESGSNLKFKPLLNFFKFGLSIDFWDRVLCTE